MRLGKIKCAAICVGLCGCIAALLILQRVGFRVIFSVGLCLHCRSVTLEPNVLGAEAVSEFTDKSLFKERLEVFHQNSIRSAKSLIAFAHC